MPDAPKTLQTLPLLRAVSPFLQRKVTVSDAALLDGQLKSSHSAKQLLRLLTDNAAAVNQVRVCEQRVFRPSQLAEASCKALALSVCEQVNVCTATTRLHWLLRNAPARPAFQQLPAPPAGQAEISGPASSTALLHVLYQLTHKHCNTLTGRHCTIILTAHAWIHQHLQQESSLNPDPYAPSPAATVCLEAVCDRLLAVESWQQAADLSRAVWAVAKLHMRHAGVWGWGL